MSRISSTAISFLISSILSSTDHGMSAAHTIFGVIVDEKGNSITGADVLIESTVDKKHTISSTDGSFFSDICVCGSFDEVYVQATYGLMCGTEKVCARGNHLAVDVILH